MRRFERIRSAAPSVAIAVFVLVSIVTGMPVEAKPKSVPNELLIGFTEDVSEAEAEAIYTRHGAARIEKLRSVNIHRVRVTSASVDDVARRIAAHRPHVAFVEPNSLVAPAWIPNDVSYGSQWHLPQISAPQAWDISAGTPGIVIGILDSGVDPSHPDLGSKLVAGYNFFDNNSNTADVYGHGTLVAGTAAAVGNNAIGVAGVALLNGIMPIRVAGTNGYATWSAIVNGLTWGVDHGAKIMNLSFADIAASASVKTAAQYVYNKGGIVVASAGNCGCYDATAENPYVVSVSATDPSDSVAGWSSQGNYVDVSAPGVGILTTANGGGYASVSGTSFSSPITAGVIALMLSLNPNLSPQTAVDILKANADDRGAVGYDPMFGSGRVNAYRAVAAAVAATPSPDPSPSPSPSPSPGPDTSAPVITGITTSQTGKKLTITVAVTDNVGVTKIEFYIDGSLVGTVSSGSTLSLNTRRLTPGQHIVSVRAYDAAGNVASFGPTAVTMP